MQSGFARILAIGVVLIGLLVMGGVAGFLLLFPRASGPSDVQIEVTPERLARGRYLAEHVMICTDCHSEREMHYFAGPVKPGSEGKGGERFDHSLGFPGEIYAPNITPASLADWTDGEFIRALTEGVSRDGRALFPLMPYQAYSAMAVEDLNAIVAYIRSLSPVPNQVQPTSLDFPVNFLVRLFPAKATLPESPPSKDDRLAYGAYLTRMAECAGCHSPKEGGHDIPGMEYTGGMVFPFPEGPVVAANLTPDPETGLGHWTEEQFITRFKMYDSEEGRRLDPAEIGFNTLMPWTAYAGMTEEDLGAIYTYLMSLRPVRAVH